MTLTCELRVYFQLDGTVIVADLDTRRLELCGKALDALQFQEVSWMPSASGSCISASAPFK